MKYSTPVAGGLAILMCLPAGPTASQFAPSWQGFHVGVSGGYARSDADIFSADLAAAGIVTPGSISDLSAKGNSLGLAGGYDWQMGPLVFGYDLGWTRYALRANTAFTGTIAPFGAVSGTLGTELNWMATARARAGIAAGSALFYGTAGLGIARTSGELMITTGGLATLSDSAYLGGWQIGGGVEFMLTPFLSARVELLRTRISDDMFSFSIDQVPISGRIDVINLRGGVSLRF
jgi:opacity protein-like surface antigen